MKPKRHGGEMRQWALMLALLALSWSGLAFGGGPCKPPPFDPLQSVASAEVARAMDGWAIKALRRDIKGRTCAELQELTDVLLVRWLQAHPDIRIDFEGREANRALGDPEAFMVLLKAEAWAQVKAIRKWFPRSWGQSDPDERATERRTVFVERTKARLKAH